jgi:hypothetical protein
MDLSEYDTIVRLARDRTAELLDLADELTRGSWTSGRLRSLRGRAAALKEGITMATSQKTSSPDDGRNPSNREKKRESRAEADRRARLRLAHEIIGEMTVEREIAERRRAS